MTELDEQAVSRAGEVYERTRRLANGNMWVQGASGVFGSGLNLVVDAVLIPFYAELWNDVRQVYGKGKITVQAAKEYLRPNIMFLAQDLLWDKLVGSIPIVGIPFNIAFGKALTWRLGAWFGMLSATSTEGPADAQLTRTSLELVKAVFPATSDVFAFKAPDRDVFVSFIASVDGLAPSDMADRTTRALDVMRGQPRE